MQILCQYPVTAQAVLPHCGRPVAAILPDGDIACGILDRVHDGCIVLRPLGTPEATILNYKKNIKSHPKFKALIQKEKAAKNVKRAKINAFGFGGYPFGWGYGNWGWGLGWWGIFPLFTLLALATLPFFWI